MQRFIARFRPLITGVLSGFDRLVFRGSLLPLMREGGMFFFLERAGIRLLDFGSFVRATSERIKAAAFAQAAKLGRPVRYLEWSTTDKEALARQLLAEHPLERGLICVLTAVEPCMSFEYHRSRDTNQRGLKRRPRKCLHLYKYFLHPQFGFMSARLQTWFPFQIQICLNGREWLARQLRRQRSDFKRADNCFTFLSNPELAQRLMNEQLTTEWPRALDAIAHAVNPLHDTIFKPSPMHYYWSAYQTEWATDLMFKDPRTLAELYPLLVRHATEHFKSPDVMRFLGRKAHGGFTGEIITSFKNRPEGVRVKHWVRGNSIKMYDKGGGSVLRVETTIARTSDFKVLRPLHDHPQGKLAWRPLRKGVADLHRRCQISQRSNQAYLDALAAVDDSTPCAKLFDPVAAPVLYHQRRVRALRLADPQDLALLQAVSRGEFATAGFRNRDIRSLIHPPAAPHSPDARRLSAKTSRQLRMLRAHGLVTKIHKTHRYRLTPKGQLLTAALFATRRATIKQLLSAA